MSVGPPARASIGDLPLAGRVAIVTGASRGIGAATAVALARSGAAVALVARGGDRLGVVARAVADVGRPHVVVTADLADPSAASRAVAAAREALGPPDVLVNDAATLGPIAPLPGIDPEAWRRALDLNVSAPLAASLAVLPDMLARGRGWIVNVSSGAAAGPGMQFGSAYTVSKVALEALTRHMAAELEATGVCVNAVRPGRVDTGMQATLRDPAQVGDQLAARHGAWAAGGELIPPEIPALLIAGLCATDRTGQVISVYDEEGRRLVEATADALGERASLAVY